MTSSDTKFSLHIQGKAAAAHTVPASVVVQVLQSTQRVFELIGVHIEGRGVRQRARVPAMTSRRFELRCEPAQPGSYVIPMRFSSSDDLITDQARLAALGLFREITQKISVGRTDELSDHIPDDLLLRRLLEAIKHMAPHAGSQWYLTLHDQCDLVFATFDAGTVNQIEATLLPADRRQALEVVIGELKSIDFSAREVRIIYPPKRTLLTCIYDEAVEDLLYERRRDLIQVTGKALLDETGMPIAMIDVNDIRDVDLSVVELDAVRHNGLVLLPIRTLLLQPELDASKQLFCVEYPELDIDVFARTRKDLFTELNEQIAMLWLEYAMAADDELEANALRLKRKLLGAFREAIDAT
jgi:hypothetical protein